MPEDVEQDWGISFQSMKQPEVLINQEAIPTIQATPNRIFSYSTVSQGTGLPSTPHQKNTALPWMFPGLVPASLLQHYLKERKEARTGRGEHKSTSKHNIAKKTIILKPYLI